MRLKIVVTYVLYFTDKCNSPKRYIEVFSGINTIRKIPLATILNSVIESDESILTSVSISNFRPFSPPLVAVCLKTKAIVV